MLHTLDIKHWQDLVCTATQQQTINALETGSVIFLPQLSFELESTELHFLSPNYTHPDNKNISLNLKNKNLQGAVCNPQESLQLTKLLSRYASQASLLIKALFPRYFPDLTEGRTSYRPIEIAGRKPASVRKDDTLLHIDAFPATPTQGKRILRVFTNVNPFYNPRVWRLGAPFPKVAEYFHPKLKRPVFGSATLLKMLKITKAKRAPYDHYMLLLHNAMKEDQHYQQQVPQSEFHFPSGSTWIVYTDQVSHAALAGQFIFEQTFYIPTHALAHEEHSPLKVLENFLHRTLL